MNPQTEAEKHWLEDPNIFQAPVARRTFNRVVVLGLGSLFFPDLSLQAQADANPEGAEVASPLLEEIARINLKDTTTHNPEDMDILLNPEGKNKTGLIGQRLSVKEKLKEEWEKKQKEDPDLPNILFEVPLAATVNWEETDGGEQRIGMSNAEILEKIAQSELIKDDNNREKNAENRPDSTDSKPAMTMTWQEYYKLLDTEDDNLNPTQQILKKLEIRRLDQEEEKPDGIFAKGIVGYVAGLPLSERAATEEEIRVMPETIIFAKPTRNGFEVHLVESTINTYIKNEKEEWDREESREGTPSNEHNLGHLITRPRIVDTNYGTTTVYENYQLDGSVKLLVRIKRQSDGQTIYKSIAIATEINNGSYPYIEASQGPENSVLITYRVKDGIKLINIQPNEEEIEQANIPINMPLNNVPANVRYIGKDSQGNNLYRSYGVIEDNGQTSLFCQDLDSKYKAVGHPRNLPLNGINGRKIKNFQTFLLEEEGGVSAPVLLVIGEHTRGLRNKGYIVTDNGYNEELLLYRLFDPDTVDIFNFRIRDDLLHILTRNKKEVFTAHVLRPKSPVAGL